MDLIRTIILLSLALILSTSTIRTAPNEPPHVVPQAWSLMEAPVAASPSVAPTTTSAPPTTSAPLPVSAPVTTIAPTTSTSEKPKTTTSSAPTSTSSAEEMNSSEIPDFASFKNTSTFTCYGKETGYYADVKLGCRVYHFCTQMDSLGDTPPYQRMSYICLEDSYFDQKDLNCVRKEDLKVPCDRAELEYEKSNKQFDPKEESQPSMSDSLRANIMMNPITRFFAGR